ncbi:disulfide bond formation protein B [Candidatus Neptunichlamydia sp. REUL1]|uniref:disulfide bond formation protein B n=1 Tax=Candidatus Neptunichlamydia sp. REUL1 TaxID=3064277 RepID=UPI00292CC9B7|nr:disulfide bond formation protein B [Candidatus Neptunochlamydia sp. REUL1]
METSKRIFLNRWFLAMIAIGSVALACSISAVHVFHLKPCVMCKLQRIPFALLIVNSGFGLLSSYKQGFFKVAQVCLALGVVLGMGHFLMQMGALPDFCTLKKGFDTTQEFSMMLKTSKCSDIAWSIFGVPVSLLNAMLHTLVLGLGYRFSLKKGLMGAL